MKRPDPVIEALRTVPGLRTQSDRDLARLAQLVDRADIPAGDRLTREGAMAHQAFLVIDGAADVFIDGEAVASVGPGDFVGEIAMLDTGPRSATVRASTRMTVLVIGPQAFGAFVEHGAVARTMAAQLAKRLRRADNTLTH
jgi:CRP/FNR family cyclic AMP-dependent transcriptional regulator